MMRWLTLLVALTGCRSGFETLPSDGADGGITRTDGATDSAIPITSTDPWCDDEFSLRLPIRIDYTRVEGRHVGFPMLLVWAEHPDLRDRAEVSGGGFRFYMSDCGDPLPFDMQQYDSSNGGLTAWLRLPSLSSSPEENAPIPYLYFRDSVIERVTAASDVWTEGFSSVWHLEEEGTDVADEFRDQTRAANHGRGGGGAASPVREIAPIGHGQLFDGVDDFIALPTSAAAIGQRGTISHWARLDDSAGITFYQSDGTGELYNGFGIGDPLHHEVHLWLDMRSVGSIYSDGSAQLIRVQAMPSVTIAGVWRFLVFTWDLSSNMRMYLDGEVVKEERANDVSFAGVTPTHVVIGRPPSLSQAPVRAFGGVLDEVRVASEARTPAWIRTEWRNQSNPREFATPGRAEARQP